MQAVLRIGGTLGERNGSSQRAWVELARRTAAGNAHEAGGFLDFARDDITLGIT
jgi:hypothetical protein